MLESAGPHCDRSGRARGNFRGDVPGSSRRYPSRRDATINNRGIPDRQAGSIDPAAGDSRKEKADVPGRYGRQQRPADRAHHLILDVRQGRALLGGRAARRGQGHDEDR